MGRYGLGSRNEAGERIVKVETANQLAIVNRYF